VVGSVVALRASLAWFERRPLFGKRVLVTREESAGGRLVSALRDAGAEPLVAPMIRIAEPEDWSLPDRCLAELDAYDAILITSANAVRSLEARARALGRSLAESGVPVWCVGPETARVTREFGVPVHAIPPERHDAEGLLAALRAQRDPAGRRFLFPCAAAARDVLPDGLAAAGARVDRAVVYRTLAPEMDAEALRGLLADGAPDVLTFTSPSAVRNFSERLDAAARATAKRCLIAAIGPVTAAALGRVGLEADVVSERAGMRELVDAIAERVTVDPGGSR
jgi:uroporphyrinogen III methyltransferase/synthase